jgi:hypothetical protein
MQSMLFKIGVDLKKRNLSEVELITDEPYIEIYGISDKDIEINQICDSYKKLLIFLKENEKNILESEDDIKNQFITIDELMNDIDNVLIKENVSPINK